MDLYEVTHRAIAHTLRGHADERIRRVHDAGWSTLHVLEHIRLFEVFLTRLFAEGDKAPRMEETTSPDLSLALVRSRKFRSPDSIGPVAIAASADDGLAALDAALAGLRAAHAAVSDDVLDRHGMVHPVFGMLSLRQWYDLGGLHLLRHMAQIHDMVTSAP